LQRAARSHRKIPDDLWPQLSHLPGINIDKASFERDGYDVIYRAWLTTDSGAKEVWARVGSTAEPLVLSLEEKLLKAARDLGV
jgi:hypothetical protein